MRQAAFLCNSLLPHHLCHVMASSHTISALPRPPPMLSLPCHGLFPCRLCHATASSHTISALPHPPRTLPLLYNSRKSLETSSERETETSWNMSQNKFSSFHFFLSGICHSNKNIRRKPCLTLFTCVKSRVIVGLDVKLKTGKLMKIRSRQRVLKAKKNVSKREKRISCDIEKLGIRQNTKLDTWQSVYLVRFWTWAPVQKENKQTNKANQPAKQEEHSFSIHTERKGSIPLYIQDLLWITKRN